VKIQEDLVAAEAEIQKELQSNPEFVPALMAQAVLDPKQGQISTGNRKGYDTILRRWPEFATCAKNAWPSCTAQGPFYHRCGVRSCSKSAAKTLSDDPGLTELLGQLELRKKELSPGCAVVRGRLHDNGRLEANSLFYLGMSQLQARQTAEARGALNQALAGGSSGTARDRSQTRHCRHPEGIAAYSKNVARL